MARATCYQLHLLYDKYHDAQCELVDSLAERIQLPGGISIAMAADIAETRQSESHLVPTKRFAVQFLRLPEAHQSSTERLADARRVSEIGDDSI